MRVSRQFGRDVDSFVLSWHRPAVTVCTPWRAPDMAGVAALARASYHVDGIARAVDARVAQRPADSWYGTCQHARDLVRSRRA